MQTFLQIAQTISYMPNSELSTINGISDITNEERNAINEALKTVWNESSTFDFRYKKSAMRLKNLIRTKPFSAKYAIFFDEILDFIRFLTNYFP